MTLSTWTIAQSTAGLSPATSARFDAAVRHEIVQLVDGYKKEAAAYSPATSIMWERILASLEGGKLTRPRLVRLGYDAFAPQRRQEQPAEKRVVLLGCAFELLHTSLLMHDDVIDRDFTRRGRPTLSAQYRDDALAAGQSRPDADHAGHSAAIIAGDLLLAASIAVALRAGASLDHAGAIERSFQLAIHNAGAGELEDLLYSLDHSPAKVQDVLRMEGLKTASYSFRFPLQTGALLAGASPAQAAALADIGGQLGVAYQLIDDVLGTFGDPGKTGKSVDSDLREGKSTILTALAAEQPEFGENLKLLRTHTATLKSLRSALAAADAEPLARQLAKELCDGALFSARQLALPEAVSAQLKDFATLILTRGA
ncbi:geranylgeranyl diphosphate synthase type II [Arthrobacter stackebrandtii]|uniref:Geranylgeranyl diphosphate synthase type II n=1 Tax=Arthrobacter stackebrandtii TaxID=272161 RepID=A0ABS4YZI9_9MICC|nr:polyprenyl synthetase family protein [Arthrobacter stackebrandtii]MBP2414213.1 geranylgeranyl diphosphate synthase type II [Arthrobacter stackebrandtii]PYG98924.1 farnesyltranstransferase [Arthrobacter stackebrandtii]